MERGAGQRNRPGLPLRTIVILGAVAFVVLLVGGYGLNWTWTGFSANDHLWDWLQLLVYPVVLAALPVWFSTRHKWGLQWKVLLTALLVAFVVVVIGGYAFNWTWTGFKGNKLWDWWKLLLVPFVLPVVLTWFSTHHDQVNNATSAAQQAATARSPEPAPAAEPVENRPTAGSASK